MATIGALIEREPSKLIPNKPVSTETSSVPTYTSPFDASQQVDKVTYDALMQDFNATQQQKEVSSLSTKNAISKINDQKAYLDTTYPPAGWDAETYANFKKANPTLEPDAEDTKMMQEAGQGKAYFTNPLGQEAEYTQEQLNDPTTRQFLTDNGYALVRSEGVNVGSDFSTSGFQSSLKTSNQQIENLAQDFLNYNVDQDPDFQAQSASIKAGFDRLKRQTEVTNQQRAQSYRTLGLRTGATQYAEGVQMGIEGEELRQANQRIADIVAEEASTIAQARAAFKNNKFSEFNAKVTALKDIRDQKQKELEGYNTAIANYTKKLQEEETNLLQQQKLKQEILEGNLDLYSSALIGYDAGGNMKIDEEQINAFAEQLGVPSALLKSRAQAQMSELAKLSQEEYKRELDIMNAQRNMIPAAFQEYEYAKDNLGYTGDFFDYLAQKEQISTSMPASYKEWQLAGEPGEYADWLKKGLTNDMSPQQVTIFNRIVDKYQASPLVKAEDRVSILNTVTEELRGDPTNSSLQVSFIYSLIQALDTYQSAVREGEIGLIEGTQGLGDKIKNLPNKILKGSVLSEDKVNQYLSTADVLANSIRQSADKKKKQFESQANVSGVGDAWNGYIQGSQPPVEIGTKFKSWYKGLDPSEQKEIDGFLLNPDFGDSPEEAMQNILEMKQVNFTKPLSMGVKSSDVSKIKDGTKVVTVLGSGIATGIEQGSSKWKWGFDFVLQGGKGAPVKAPFSGEVVFAGNNRGFGNQVKIKLANGQEIWLSHLDGINVRKGQKVTQGVVIGKQGNTGALLSSSGQELTPAQRKAGRGTHIDITIKKPDGKYMTSKEVASFLNTRINQA